MKLIKRILIGITSLVIILILGLFLFLKFYTPRLSNNNGKVDAQLFTSDSENQPLIVAFGGSQGGNTWTEDYWSDMRVKFLNQGYAVLSIGYFNVEGIPKTLDRISLNAIYDTIKSISNNPKINKERIMLLGTSRGGELVLNLASRFNDFDAIVALVPSHVRFPAASITANTSGWMFEGQELPFLQIPYRAVLTSIAGNKQKAWEIILGEENSTPEAEIEVEKMNCPILLLSAKDDKEWPSKYMCDKIVNRLSDNNYKYYYEHISVDGGHYVMKEHFDKVFEFVEDHFQPALLVNGELATTI
jgi:dienelactone hydrolase